MSNEGYTVPPTETTTSMEQTLGEYTDRLVFALDQIGEDFHGFPGIEVTLPEVDDYPQLLRMGITEPYPNRSPRFGAILHTHETKEEHLVLSVGNNKEFTTEETEGYAVTNVRNDQPRKLYFSTSPRGNYWKEVTEDDPDYKTHISRFTELTATALDSMVQNAEAGVKETSEEKEILLSTLTNHAKTVAKFDDEKVRMLARRTKELGITPEDIDELHADQSRLVKALESLDRKRDITGTKIPRTQRTSRVEHGQVAARARQSLEASYGIVVNKRGKVAEGVAANVMKTMGELDSLRRGRDSRKADGLLHKEIVASLHERVDTLTEAEKTKRSLLDTITAEKFVRHSAVNHTED